MAKYFNGEPTESEQGTMIKGKIW